jgi:hypothetical protein
VQAKDIYHKTTKGQAEIETRSGGLTMKQRRVLILVNGANDTAELTRMSLCDDVADILQTLAENGFIDDGGAMTTTAIRAQNYTASEKPASSSSSDAGEFMCNTLLTFANRIRVGELIEEIKAAQDLESLDELIEPWYHAISETPGGMYQADDLRDELRKMIEARDNG